MKFGHCEVRQFIPHCKAPQFICHCEVQPKQSNRLLQRLRVCNDRARMVYVILLGLLCLTPAFARPVHWCHYHNKFYKFALSYPCYIKPTHKFRRFYHLANNWSAAVVSPKKKGQVNIIAIPLAELEGKNGFYYAAAVRIGVSSNPQDVKSCYAVNMYYKPFKPATVSIHGLKFKRFPMTDNGMMQVMQGQSYRLRHQGHCYALEWVETGLNGKHFNTLSHLYQPLAQKIILSFSGFGFC